MIFVDRLQKAGNFDHVFEVVKASVEQILKRHRAGLSLILAELPGYIGAYHVLGSNIIVLNRYVLAIVQAKAKSPLEVNSFIFGILTHEYLHSLGYTDEGEVRFLVSNVCSGTLGEEHMATKMARSDLSKLYPEILSLGMGWSRSGFQLVKEFDKASMPYIG